MNAWAAFLRGREKAVWFPYQHFITHRSLPNSTSEEREGSGGGGAKVKITSETCIQYSARSLPCLPPTRVILCPATSRSQFRRKEERRTRHRSGGKKEAITRSVNHQLQKELQRASFVQLEPSLNSNDNVAVKDCASITCLVMQT